MRRQQVSLLKPSPDLIASETRKGDSAQVAAARERLLIHLRAKAGADRLDEEESLHPYACVLASSRVTEYAAAVIAADEHGITIAAKEIGLFVERLVLDEVLERFSRLKEWLRADNPNTHESVEFTPVLAEFLSRPGDLEELLAEVDRLKAETHNGRFSIDNPVQRDLEFRRFHHEYAKIAPAIRELPYHGLTADALHEIFSRLKMLPPSQEAPLTINPEHALQAQRTAYEAAGLLRFLLDFRARTNRHIVVLGNTRYGRQWVVEPLEDYLGDGFSLRYDRVPSHMSMRLTVPYARQRERDMDEIGAWTPDAMPREFARQLAATMPHVVIEDGMSPKPHLDMMLLSRATKIYAHWFVAFNDVRARGETPSYLDDCMLPPDHIAELMHWYEYIALRKQLTEWIDKGSTYRLSLWTPEPTEYARLGELTIRCRQPDLVGDRPQVILANPIIYGREGELPEYLYRTSPYYFDGPERFVSERVVMGFGPYGYSPRFEGPTTAEFVAAIQNLMKEEIGRWV